jgi:hypothetical protein
MMTARLVADINEERRRLRQEFDQFDFLYAWGVAQPIGVIKRRRQTPDRFGRLTWNGR